jgi:hypothetical protein
VTNILRGLNVEVEAGNDAGELVASKVRSTDLRVARTIDTASTG